MTFAIARRPVWSRVVSTVTGIIVLCIGLVILFLPGIAAALLNILFSVALLLIGFQILARSISGQKTTAYDVPSSATRE
ncbi:MAG TPA: hypothetical protein VFF30_06305 [Nitrososphaerales archaeon]|nr:hypothetical protein [Nitrososphaerales archaeon]